MDYQHVGKTKTYNTEKSVKYRILNGKEHQNVCAQYNRRTVAYSKVYDFSDVEFRTLENIYLKWILQDEG